MESMKTDKPTVIVGVQAGDLPSDQATNPHLSLMRKLLQAHCRGPYSPDVDEFSLVVRVDGDIWHWEQEGCDRMRRSKRDRYITIDIYVPRHRWQGVKGMEIRAYLAGCVEDAFQRMIAKLKKDKVAVDGDALLRDFARVKEQYLSLQPAAAAG